MLKKLILKLGLQNFIFFFLYIASYPFVLLIKIRLIKIIGFKKFFDTRKFQIITWPNILHKSDSLFVRSYSIEKIFSVTYLKNSGYSKIPRE